MPYPGCAFNFRELIKVEERLPFRSLGLVGVQGCAPPEALWVFGVRPEVVEPFPARSHRVSGLRHRGSPAGAFQRVVLFVLKLTLRGAVTLFDPCERILPSTSSSHWKGSLSGVMRRCIMESTLPSVLQTGCNSLEGDKQKVAWVVGLLFRETTGAEPAECAQLDQTEGVHIRVAQLDGTS